MRPRPRPKNPVKYKEHGGSKLLATGFFQGFMGHGVAGRTIHLIHVK